MSVDKKKTPKNKGGRPAYEPNDRHYQIIRALCIFGASHKYIAQYINVSEKTIRKHYRELLDDCMYDRNKEVESSLFYNAVVKKNFHAQKYWLDNHKRDTYNTSSGPTESETTQDIIAAIVDELPD